MRLGAPLFAETSTPASWIAALRNQGYGAAYCPVGWEAGGDTIDAYARAAADAGIVIAEVGAWSNPLSPDPDVARTALDYCKRQLALAERIGARCCVNIAGSRGSQWDGPDARNFTDETFELIVATVQDIIDSVQPTRTYYTLETMPNMYPDSTESYRALVEAIQRDRFAVHFDPVNIISSPRRYFDTGGVIREFVSDLGAMIRSCHAKDILLSGRFTVHLDEIAPGQGGLDYRTYLLELDRLDPDVPLMIEHLQTAEEFAAAAAHIRSVADEVGVTFLQ